jgi:hypothetical protein
LWVDVGLGVIFVCSFGLLLLTEFMGLIFGQITLGFVKAATSLAVDQF